MIDELSIEEGGLIMTPASSELIRPDFGVLLTFACLVIWLGAILVAGATRKRHPLANKIALGIFFGLPLLGIALFMLGLLSVS